MGWSKEKIKKLFQTWLMKKVCLIVFPVFLALTSYSQYVYKIKADTVLITNDSCNAELTIENSTRNVCGFLYNTGNGRTEFRSALLKVDSLTYVSGCDTLRLHAGTGSGINIYNTDSVFASDRTVGLNGKVFTIQDSSFNAWLQLNQPGSLVQLQSTKAGANSGLIAISD